MYQTIRACRAIAPVFIPGASELEKLVASAEAWAREACGVLRIKVKFHSSFNSGVVFFSGIISYRNTAVVVLVRSCIVIQQ